MMDKCKTVRKKAHSLLRVGSKDILSMEVGALDRQFAINRLMQDLTYGLLSWKLSVIIVTYVVSATGRWGSEWSLNR